jgi:peptidoglycan L-alanyl-D-glutamate endopeptidase CwlK
MPHFGRKSVERLNTVHKDLQLVLYAAIEDFDFSVICGKRSEDEQNEAFAAGRSKLKWPESKHNKVPSRAVDIAPHPLDWTDTESFLRMAAVVLEKASRLGVPLRWGGNWTTFRDMPHFELVE